MQTENAIHVIDQIRRRDTTSTSILYTQTVCFASKNYLTTRQEPGNDRADSIQATEQFSATKVLKTLSQCTGQRVQKPFGVRVMACS